MTRSIILIACILKAMIVFSQDTTVTWLTTINTGEFKIAHRKRAIPKKFYTIIGINSLKDIASANMPYRKGCIANGLPGQRLNWLAKDNKDHWVLSVSFGGRGHSTKYIFIDHEKNEANVNGFYFMGDNRNNLTLDETIAKIKSGEYYRMAPSLFK